MIYQTYIFFYYPMGCFVFNVKPLNSISPRLNWAWECIKGIKKYKKTNVQPGLKRAVAGAQAIKLDKLVYDIT